MGKQTRIVLIDDDKDACELLKMQLEENGDKHVTFSTNNEEAVSLIAQEQPDLAILDINMPGVHGVELSAALAAEQKTSTIPILYLSGMVTPEEVTALVEGETTPSIISKGSPLQDLIAAIDSITNP